MAIYFYQNFIVSILSFFETFSLKLEMLVKDECILYMNNDLLSVDSFSLMFFSNFFFLQIMVTIIICIVSLLFVYMVFLLCLDPLLVKKPGRYTEQTNEEVNLVNTMAADNEAFFFLLTPFTLLWTVGDPKNGARNHRHLFGWLATCTVRL